MFRTRVCDKTEHMVEKILTTEYMFDIINKTHVRLEE